MKATLAKPWGPHTPGSTITTDAAAPGELQEGLLVDQRRFEQLEEQGFFAPPAPASKAAASSPPKPPFPAPVAVDPPLAPAPESEEEEAADGAQER